MGEKTVLVVGGTGPTGPDIVNGLVERGFRTAIFHSGRHEVPLPDVVEHIHGDPHFPETIAEALGVREFDVVIAQYGRLRHLARHFSHRTAHLISIGGFMGPLASVDDPRWGPLGRPAVVRETARVSHQDGSDNKLGLRMAQAHELVMELRGEGAFKATHIGYPLLYGPRQPGSSEWSIVRRLRDGRRRLILPDGGIRIDSRGFIGNVSQAPLLVADNPDAADGKSYVVTDRELYTVRQRVEFLAAHFGVEVEIVSLPYEVATPAHPLYRLGPDHRAGTAEEIRADLGYVDRVAAGDAMALTADWLTSADANIEEIEKQLGDSFDYEYEDRLLEWWDGARGRVPEATSVFSYQHNYRHPVKPG